ncbi:MAG: NADH-quinone oxidoreductase subunit NuoF [Armatimonadota bacterium]
MPEHVLLRNRDIPNIAELDVYREHDGYEAWARAAREMTPQEVIEVVSEAELRGCGGAFFPTGRKWSLTIRDGGPNYLCCNGDESEPGTFKDRELMQFNPHQVLEGCCIAAYANDAETVYIYVRGEFHEPIKSLERAIQEAHEAGYLGDDVLGTGKRLHIYVHVGAGAYICGEETALLSSVDGTRGWPRLKPPFPGQSGVNKRPTVVNNVETLSNVPPILRHGPEWFKQWGTERAPGRKIYCLSGHVNRPGNYEAPMGTPLRELIYDHAGGVPGGKRVKAVIPGGSSTPYLAEDQLDVNMDPESVRAAGSMLGSAAVIVLDEDTCIVRATRRLVKFYMRESCGQCTPCREGCRWLWLVYGKILEGQAEETDLDLLLDICDGIATKSLCLLGDSATFPVVSSLRLFREEYEHHIRHGTCGGYEPQSESDAG